MDTDQIISKSRARFDHAIAKKVLKEKYDGKMIFAHAGGMWRAGPELQNTLLTCSGLEAVLLDLYDNPIKVYTRELMTISQQRWQEQMNAWLVEHQELNKKR